MIIALYMAFISRCCGGLLKLPAENFLYALPYLILFNDPLIGAIAVIGAGIGKGTGHGQYMDLGTWKAHSESERLDFIVRLFFGYDTRPNYWRDFLGLAVTGMAVTIIPGMCLSFFDPLQGLILALSGALKAPAYAIGWKLPKWHTEIGEILTGAFCGAVIALLL